MASQHPKSKQAASKSPGGTKLQELRNAAGLTLLDLATKLESEPGKAIDAAHINKIETGSIKKPLAETLEAILVGLDVTYRERRTVLEAFGYKIPMTLPTHREVEEAIRLSAHELEDATYPVCLIDHGQRYWAWNRYTPRLVRLHPDDPATRHFFGATTFDLVLNPAFETRLLIANLEEFLPAVLQFMKVDMDAYCEQPWYQELIHTVNSFPGAKTLWEQTPADTLRSVIPLKVKMSDGNILQFRMSSADLLLDPRFQILHFTPFGAHTLRVCATWAEEEGVF